jgi:two-component system KDP operon response regulator KdpE
LEASDKTRLFVDADAASTAAQLRDVLSAEGYQVRVADDGEGTSTPASYFGGERPDIVVVNGIERYRRIRSFVDVPIIVLALRSDEQVKALDAGADDCVIRSIAVDELCARIRAVLRRANAASSRTSLTAGDFRLDFDERRVYVQQSQVRLTPKEFDLFAYMARHPNRVVPHKKLLSEVWGHEWVGCPQYLWVFMFQLRRKVEPEPSRPRYLVSEPWVGYRFNPHGVVS